MICLPPASNSQARRAIAALSLRGLIRLVSEIDDHGPISRRRGSLQAAFDDLSTDQLRLAIDRARTLDLVDGDEDEEVRYQLTDSGRGLAEVYDTAARWARTHQFPTAASDFVTRVQHTLDLLGHTPTRGGDGSGIPVTGGAVLDGEAIAALNGPHSVLTAWLQAHAHPLPRMPFDSCRAADEMEIAA
ncbi:hypothetical protein GPA10_37340 [Streptomyces sp. p1417]|uniref:Uncharacterized protein n=1 Tax=Streptomyces typhae TaxID=2681492 RepID=A0A6L6X9A3_9ACTN|nr:hypothetical protein [Streptomyces typhae]MVO90267.1 hypothetical protein [Streptomyces typhae]